MRLIVVLSLTLGLIGCLSEPAAAPPAASLSAQALTDSAIAAHGGSRYQHQLIQFDFRDRHYSAFLSGGRFIYTRSFVRDAELVRDQLDNQGLTRTVNARNVALPDSTADAYANSVNSVIYFALLPYFLHDAAVQKERLGRSTLDSVAYHLLRVTFRQEGGGEDFDDEFLYWIHPETYRVDFLAYSYDVDGGGLRFRSAYHPREVGGIRFQDYVNYRADHHRYTLADLAQLYRKGQLEELSRIELQALSVQDAIAP